MRMERRRFLQAAAASALALTTSGRIGAAEPKPVAQTPPMGWNSWDCFGASVREEEVRANADYMASHLHKFGWEYIVVDIQWYEPTADGSNYHKFAKLEMDVYGRLIPAVNRFPSASGGKGFQPLAKYCQDKGLKFGIHILRGIPRQAVKAKTPLFGSRFTAADVADTQSVCPWNTDMFGVDPAKPGAQDWYNSIIRQYHEWGVNFIKVDDLSNPYHAGEIELIRSAIDRWSPNMVFSTSPGETPIQQSKHIQKNANMWRISGDFWDSWPALRHAFDLCARWQGAAGPGHWPDADMLPLGRIGLRSSENGHGARQTLFTKDEQTTLMTLWCMARSPLMFGGNLPDNDPWTLSLLTNPDVLAILKSSKNNRELMRNGDLVAWAAEGEKGSQYLALFNLGSDTLATTVRLSEFNLPAPCRLRDLWQRQDMGDTEDMLTQTIPTHGALLLRLSQRKS